MCLRSSDHMQGYVTAQPGNCSGSPAQPQSLSSDPPVTVQVVGLAPLEGGPGGISAVIDVCLCAAQVMELCPTVKRSQLNLLQLIPTLVESRW